MREAGEPMAPNQGTAHAFWLRTPGCGEIRRVSLPRPGRDDVLVRTPHPLVEVVEARHDPLDVVPDQVVFRIDRRVIPEEDPAEVEKRCVICWRHGGAGYCRSARGDRSSGR